MIEDRSVLALSRNAAYGNEIMIVACHWGVVIGVHTLELIPGLVR
jgi:hypothetical protein